MAGEIFIKGTIGPRFAQDMADLKIGEGIGWNENEAYYNLNCPAEDAAKLKTLVEGEHDPNASAPPNEDQIAIERARRQRNKMRGQNKQQRKDEMEGADFDQMLDDLDRILGA